MTDDGKNAVGYRHPPANRRFRPGQSGNPAGRPKHGPSFRAALLAELAEAMPGAGKRGPDSKLQALVRTLVDTAIGGNVRAQSVLVGVLTRIGDGEDSAPIALTSDDREILDAYVGGELKRRETDAEPTPGERRED
jgi:hypothetical protein